MSCKIHINNSIFIYLFIEVIYVSEDTFKNEMLQRLTTVETNLSVVMGERSTITNELSLLKQETTEIKELANAAIIRTNDLNSRITSLTTFAITFILFVIGLVFALK